MDKKGVRILLCLMGALTGATEFFFKYEDFYINETFATIAWKVPLSCMGSISYSIVKAARGNVVTPKNSCSIQEVFTIISKTSLQIEFDNVYKIYVNACCDGIQFTIQNSIAIPAEVQTEVVAVKPSRDVCLQPSSLAITVIWSKQNMSGESCACSRWYQVQRCSCVTSGRITNVYNIGDSREEFKICWSNITNHTKVHFVIESENPTDLLNPIPFPIVNQEFIRTYDLVLAENPHSPEISINMTDEQGRLMLCLQDIYDGQSPITYYVVTITDITSYGSTYFVNRTSNRCHDIPRNEPNYIMDCRSLNIAVQSYNGIGYSEPANFILNGRTNVDECKCFKENVQITVVELLNTTLSNIILLESRCTTQYDNLNGLSIQVELKDSTNYSIRNLTTQCARVLEMNNLMASTTYQVELKWKNKQGALCKLNDNPIFLSTLSSKGFQAKSNTMFAVIYIFISVFCIIFM